MRREELEREVEALVRRLTVESEQLGHEFAARHNLHATDFQALVHVMDAEGRGSPLTPGELATALGLSSGATTAVVDRLERIGHVRRDRDAADRRRIHLRWAEQGRAVAMDFFGGLRPLSEAVTSSFSDDDLDVVRRYLGRMSDGIAEHRRALTGDAPHAREREPGARRPAPEG